MCVCVCVCVCVFVCFSNKVKQNNQVKNGELLDLNLVKT